MKPNLFAINKSIEDSWVSETHSSIGACLSVDELNGIKDNVLSMNSPILSNYDRARLLMLEAYCNLKINLLKRLNK